MLEISIPWVTKYRPRSVDDLVLTGSDKNILKSFVEEPNKLPPSVLFYGPPGTGKTTMTMMIANSCEKSGIKVMEVFGSINNGVDYVRNTIMPACSVKGRKIIKIEEFDRFTKEAQMALRNIMGEDKYHHVSFVLSANELWRIHDAIQSRSVCIKFDSPDKKQCVTRLKTILYNEGIKFDDTAIDKQLERIVELFYPRIRDMISTLQVMSSTGEFIFDINQLSEKDGTLKAVYLVDKLVMTNYFNLKEVVRISNDVKFQSFYDIVHDKYLSAGFVEISIQCRDRLSKLNQSNAPELDFISFFKWLNNHINKINNAEFFY